MLKFLGSKAFTQAMVFTYIVMAFGILLPEFAFAQGGGISNSMTLESLLKTGWVKGLITGALVLYAVQQTFDKWAEIFGGDKPFKPALTLVTLYGAAIWWTDIVTSIASLSK